MTLEDELRELGVFLALFLPDPALAPTILAELTHRCTTDDGYNLAPWPTLWELLLDYGYAWALPWHTAPEEAAYGLRVLWESTGLPPATFPHLPATSPTAEHLVRALGAQVRAQQVVLSALYEDSDYVVLAFTKAATWAAVQQAAAAADGELASV
ncbi:MAG: hypothetical protein EOO56_05470 [Hymenobacter sp.]|nr:MAG: hypothetical protein EOO56_05470 [Hymenobacter sp.]